jgi:hypothetical protein
MDELRGAAKRVQDKLLLARERERIRVEDRLARLDEMDECAREYITIIRHMEYGRERRGAEMPRLRLLSLAEIIGDPELPGLAARLLEDERPTDERYIELARRLADLRARTFVPE